jgi:hypothetical protein
MKERREEVRPVLSLETGTFGPLLFREEVRDDDDDDDDDDEQGENDDNDHDVMLSR